ncbi:hypothetical protein FI667_g11863, partial [Globisporangium splendens]
MLTVQLSPSSPMAAQQATPTISNKEQMQMNHQQQPSESSLVLVKTQDKTHIMTKDTEEEACSKKKSKWRRIKSHLRLAKRSSRRIEDKSVLESAVSTSQRKRKSVSSFVRAILDAACPPLPPAPAPVPEPAVQMPAAYKRKDHRGVVVAGKRVPYTIHMHAGRQSALAPMESISEEC